MKIHFSNVNFGSRTGPNTFAHRLADALVKKGHDIVSDREQYDIFIAFIEPASVPRAGCLTVQRLDGIWFSPSEFHTKNTGIKRFYEFADYVIWQTKFDRDMIEHLWGKRTGSVIHNGIDLNTKVGDSIKWGESKRVFSCAASWHPQKRLKDNLALFEIVSRSHSKGDYEHSRFDDIMIVLGSVPAGQVISAKNVIYAGDLPHNQCLEVYKKSDWFFHLAWLDHCPNVVVEALSQGTPVVCSSSGGTPEIVRDNGIIVPENSQYMFELVDYDSPPEIDVSRVTLGDVTVHPEHLDITLVSEQYELVFKELRR